MWWTGRKCKETRSIRHPPVRTYENCYNRAGFVKLGTIGIWGQIIVWGWGVVLYVVGCLAVSLNSTH